MSNCPQFCVCEKCSVAIAVAHRDGDERLGRDWYAGAGCGCSACRMYRATLADIHASFARIEALDKELAAVRAGKGTP